jgi:hypothetical protein
LSWAWPLLARRTISFGGGSVKCAGDTREIALPQVLSA